MCTWCERYGEGHERWYFNPANYARRLYKVRREEAEAAGGEANPQTAGGMSAVDREFLQAQEAGDLETVERLKKQAEERAWAVHFGQVAILEEVHRILDIIYPIGLMTCVCRRAMLCTLAATSGRMVSHYQRGRNSLHRSGERSCRD